MNQQKPDAFDPPWPSEAELTPPIIVEGEITTEGEATADVTAPEPEAEIAPTFTRQDAELVVRELRDELFALRGNVTILARDVKAAEAHARQCAVDFEHGGVSITRDQLVQMEIKNHQIYREQHPEANQGNGRAFLQKQLRYGRNRVPTVSDGQGGQHLARMPDGSVVQRIGHRAHMDLNPNRVKPVTK